MPMSLTRSLFYFAGARFFISHDQLYVVKTLTSEEVEEMHALLKQYHPYVVERHGNQSRRFNLVHF